MNKLKCIKHPQYKAIKAPVKTKMHPKGCIDCWKIFKNKA